MARARPESPVSIFVTEGGSGIQAIAAPVPSASATITPLRQTNRHGEVISTSGFSVAD